MLFKRPNTDMQLAPAMPLMRMPGYTRPSLVAKRRYRLLLYAALTAFCFIYSLLMLVLPRQLLVLFSLPLMILTLFIIWALPLADTRPLPLTRTLFWALFGCLFLWPNYLALVIPGLPWITVTRFFGGPLVLLLLYYSSRSRPFRAEMKMLFSGAPLIVGLVTAFAVVQVISLAFSDAPFLTFNKILNNQITWTAMFFAGLWAMKDERGVQRWAIAFGVLASILGLMAIAEAHVGHVLWSRSIPSFFQLDEDYAQQILAGFYRLDGSYRVITTATTPLSFGELLALSIPFVLYMVDRDPKPRTIFWALVAEGLVFYGLLQADARLGFVGMLIAHFAYLFLFALAFKRKNPKSLFATSLVAAFPIGLMLAATAVLFVGRVRTRVLGSSMHQYSDDARSQQFAMGFVKFQESPLFGFGASRGGPKLGFYSPGGELTIDSYFLSILLDYGVVGVLVFYGLILYAIARCVRIAMRRTDDLGKLATAFASFMLVYLVIKSVLSQEANQPLMFMALAAITVLCLRDRQSRGEVLKPR